MPTGQWLKLSTAFPLLLTGAMIFLAAATHATETPPPPPAEEGSGNLQRAIEDKNAEIKKLEEEAARYREALANIGKTANTLQSQIQLLDRAIAGLDANIRLTNAKISRANLEIKELGEGISDKELAIERSRSHLDTLVGFLAASDMETPLEILLKNETISSYFNAVDALRGIQADIQSALANLRSIRADLKDRKGRAESKRRELSGLLASLADQKMLQLQARNERSSLLQETKNQERRYQQLLADTERKRDALQQEINSLESGLKADFDRSRLPAPSSGILGWPLPEPIFITQYFGRTEFARSGGYNGKGHNGIDLRAAVGTPVFAAEAGVVRAVGDTDLACRRASYGHWVLIDHPSGLTTLYAHLSLIKVEAGDSIGRGELIAYSGRTGYAIGPHLHLTVFAKDAINVGQLKSRVCGRVMTLPLSPFGGYLNPLDYL